MFSFVLLLAEGFICPDSSCCSAVKTRTFSLVSFFGCNLAIETNIFSTNESLSSVSKVLFKLFRGPGVNACYFSSVLLIMGKRLFSIH